jgi:DNA-binding NarL/FixJ family response regulator
VRNASGQYGRLGVVAERTVPAESEPSAGPGPWSVVLRRVELLSARERETFVLLGAGASNRTIAGRLNVTERTVKAHVTQVMAKLVVESRLQAGLVSLVYQLTYSGAPELVS